MSRHSEATLELEIEANVQRHALEGLRRRRKESHPPPQSVRVYYCTACGEPIVAEFITAAKVRTSCPKCPMGVGKVRSARYDFTPGTVKR